MSMDADDIQLHNSSPEAGHSTDSFASPNDDCDEVLLKEKPEHLNYLLNFRTKKCELFANHKCTLHRPYTCFDWHFDNQRRRKPVLRKDGTFNYNPDVYCKSYSEANGTCQIGDECGFVHRTAGDTEKRYHPRYYKTATCVHDTNEQGFCTRNGIHCAFAHGNDDLREAVYDARDHTDRRDGDASAKRTILSHMSSNGTLTLGASDDKGDVIVDDPRWNDILYVLVNYKTKLCRKLPKVCRQGYACPMYHNQKDKRRPPLEIAYRSTPCPNVKQRDDWGDPSHCRDNGEKCQYCHTRTEQQFHPEVYKSTRCNDIAVRKRCPREPFCAFAHFDNEGHRQRTLFLQSNAKEAIEDELSIINQKYCLNAVGLGQIGGIPIRLTNSRQSDFAAHDSVSKSLPPFQFNALSEALNAANQQAQHQLGAGLWNIPRHQPMQPFVSSNLQQLLGQAQLHQTTPHTSRARHSTISVDQPSSGMLASHQQQRMLASLASQPQSSGLGSGSVYCGTPPTCNGGSGLTPVRATLSYAAAAATQDDDMGVLLTSERAQSKPIQIASSSRHHNANIGGQTAHIFSAPTTTRSPLLAQLSFEKKLEENSVIDDDVRAAGDCYFPPSPFGDSTWRPLDTNLFDNTAAVGGASLSRQRSASGSIGTTAPQETPLISSMVTTSDRNQLLSQRRGSPRVHHLSTGSATTGAGGSLRAQLQRLTLQQTSNGASATAQQQQLSTLSSATTPSTPGSFAPTNGCLPNDVEHLSTDQLLTMYAPVQQELCRLAQAKALLSSALAQRPCSVCLNGKSNDVASCGHFVVCSVCVATGGAARYSCPVCCDCTLPTAATGGRGTGQAQQHCNVSPLVNDLLHLTNGEASRKYEP